MNERVVAMKMRARRAEPKATQAWLTARGLYVPADTKWQVAIGLETDPKSVPAHLHIVINSQEWGFRFIRENRTSWIRVADAPRIEGRDDFGLLPHTPPLPRLSSLVRVIEDHFDIWFQRAHATLRTNIPKAEDKLRLWLVAAL